MYDSKIPLVLGEEVKKLEPHLTTLLKFGTKRLILD